MDRKEQLKHLLSNTSALLEAMRYSASTAKGDAANIGNYSSYKMFMRKSNDLVKQAAPLLANTAMLDQFQLEKIRASGDLTWPQQKEYFDIAYSNVALLKSLLEGAIGYVEDETQRLRDFIQVNLRKTIFAMPQKEVEIQNGLESLFVGRGMTKGLDYDRETGRVKISGKESVPDFVIPRLMLCIEVKLTRTADNLKGVVDEINADIRAYSTRYERQLYIIYDLGVIRDEAEFKRNFEDTPGISVLVVKH